MEKKSASAILRYLHVAPRKTRLIASLLRGKSVNQAEAELRYSAKKAARPVLKLLRSVLANAKQASLVPEKLYITDIRVDQGPMFKRFMPRASGRAAMIQKKTSHVYITVEEKGSVSQKFKEFYRPQTQKEARKLVKDFEREKQAKAAAEERNEANQKTKKDIKEPGALKKMFRRKSV
ncbi:MAG: 50S ribosomal protein L22 [Patescibacteria group bacterium]|nr:50S ribosomal protein L22 [Patescibacteria group bacterium]MDE2437812.1 50S ribosomal protein L22 [Patescibacteria group bacterium]